MTSSSTLKLLALASVIACTGGAWADTEETTWTPEQIGAGWVYDSTNLIVTNTVTQWAFQIRKSDKMLQYVKSGVELVEVDLSALTNVTDTVTKESFRLEILENQLFKDKKSLKCVILPSSIKSCYYSAFQGCSSLESIEPYDLFLRILNNSPSPRNLFNGCTKFDGVDGTLYLEKFNSSETWVFAGTAIKHVEMPAMTTVGDSAFRGCLSLETVVMTNLTTLNAWSPFHGCTKLTTIVMPKLKTIGGRSFEGCTAFTGTLVFTNATSVGQEAFDTVTGVEAFEFPQAKSVGIQAFRSCSKLTKLDLPNVQSFSGAEMFNSSSRLKTLKFPHCMTTIDNVDMLKWSSVTNIFVHRASVFAGAAIDGTTISGMATPSGTAINKYNVKGITPYGGTTENLVYDDIAWDATTTNYVESAGVTIVAANGLTDSVVEIKRTLLPAGGTVRKPVTAIEACAFKTNEFTSVTVPKTVTRIGVAAFPEGCYIKVKNDADDPERTQALVAQLNAEYGKDDDGNDRATIDYGSGTVIIVR